MNQPLTPVVVRVLDPATRETSVADILVGAVGLVGFMLLMAALVGLVVGGLFIAFKKLRPNNPFNGDTDQTVRLGLSSPVTQK